jgi:hypothetical protein
VLKNGYKKYSEMTKLHKERNQYKEERKNPLQIFVDDIKTHIFIFIESECMISVKINLLLFMKEEKSIFSHSHI